MIWISLLISLSTSAQGPTKADQWKKDYLRAQDYQSQNIKASCDLFLNLSKQRDFPLRKLALIRSQSVCPKASRQDWKGIRKFAPESWLTTAVVEEKFQIAQKDNNHPEAFALGNANRKLLKLLPQDLVDILQKALKTEKGKSKRNLTKELHKRAPRFLPNPKKSQFLAVAKDHRTARNFVKAHKYYDRIINERGFDLTQKWKALQGKKVTYKLRRWQKMSQYISASKKWARFLDSKYKTSKKLTRLHHSAGIAYVRTLWTEKGQTSALKELLNLEKQLKGRYTMQSVFWLKAKMAEERGDTKVTLEWLQKSAKERSLSEDDTVRGLWNLAWNQRRQKLFDQSTDNLKILLKRKSLTFYTLTKYKFWLAQNLKDKGDTKDSKKAFEDLIETDPFGFYGALAYRALNKPFPKIEYKTYPDKDLWAMFQKPEDYQIFNWLVDVMEPKVAQSFLQAEVKTQRGWSTESWIKYLLLMQKSQNFIGFFAKFHSRGPQLQADIHKKAPYLLFPQPFAPVVGDVSKKTNVDVALIYSIMKQESGFDPHARSFADAFGLMQLLPQIAKKTAADVPSSGYKKAEDLYKPNVNIHLGAQTLKTLFHGFKDQFILSVASYNASKTAVRGWVNSRFEGDPVTFIEDIPYEETKGYVKLVLRNFISYSRFLEPSVQKSFPEDTLQGLEKFKTK